MKLLGDVKLGWKLYVLAWTWLGIAMWIGDSIEVAAVFWAVGASVAWVLAPMVARSGWPKALGYLLIATSVVVLVVAISRAVLAEDLEQRALGFERAPQIQLGRVGGIRRRPGADERRRAELLRALSTRLFGASAVLGVAGLALWWTAAVRKRDVLV